MTVQAVLQVQNLSFSYPGRHVFTGFSAEFLPGLVGSFGGL